MEIFSRTVAIGTSKIVSIKESSPNKKRSESPCLILGDNSSQKRARTSAKETNSVDLSCAAPKVATSRTQRRISRSPSKDSACLMEWISFEKENTAEFKYLNNR